MTDQFHLQFRPAVPKGGDSPHTDALSTAQPPTPDTMGRDVKRRRRSTNTEIGDDTRRRRAIIEIIVMLEALPREDQKFIAGLFG